MRCDSTPCQPWTWLQSAITVSHGDFLWEESLLELSGGQRSLVALASVFSPQQFRPTPLYIFDEVQVLILGHSYNMHTLCLVQPDHVRYVGLRCACGASD